MDPMKQALQKRRGKGLEISIMMGKGPESPEEKSGEKAPAVKDLSAGDPSAEEAPEMAHEKSEDQDLQKLMSLVQDNPEAMKLVHKMMGGQAQAESPASEDQSVMDDHVMGGMSDMDQSDLSSRDKPRSLFERAKMEMMKRGKKA